MKSAVAIRTHKFGEAEKKSFDFLSDYFGRENTFLTVKKSEKTPDVPEKYNPIFFGADTLNKLYQHPECGHRCGDYWYYALLPHILEYDNLWLVEPDVYFGSSNPANFFDDFVTSNCDFLCTGYGHSTDKLFYHHTGKHVSGKTMSCLFPLTRIKVEAIKFLYQERQHLSKLFENAEAGSINKVRDYPNDEIFVATTLTRRNALIGKLEELSRCDFRWFTADADKALTKDQVIKMSGDFLIHPVLSQEEFIAKKKNIFLQKLNNNQSVSNWLTSSLRKQSHNPTKQKLKRSLLSEFESFLDDK